MRAIVAWLKLHIGITEVVNPAVKALELRLELYEATQVRLLQEIHNVKLIAEEVSAALSERRWEKESRRS